MRQAVVEQAQGKGIFHAEASAWLVVALCDAGKRAEAEAVMGRFPLRHLAVLPGLANWARGVLACARGRTGDGAQLLAAAAEEAATVGATLIEAFYLAELADRCATDAAISRIDELAHIVDAPLLQQLCRAAVARLKGYAEALTDVAASLAAGGLTNRAKAAIRDAERIARTEGDQNVARRAGRIRRRLGSQSAPDARTHRGDVTDLTVRESEVAGLAAGGLTDREIAARLVLSVRTIESHLASAYRKLGVSSRIELSIGLG